MTRFGQILIEFFILNKVFAMKQYYKSKIFVQSEV